MFDRFQSRLANWVGRDRDFFLAWLLFGSAVQCFGFSVYAIALAGGWISYHPQTFLQGWLSWLTYMGIWFVAALLNGCTQMWLLGARVGKANTWFYLALLSAALTIVVKNLFVSLFQIPAFAQPLLNLIADLCVGFTQAFFLRRFSTRAFVWVLVPICATTLYTVLNTASDNFGSTVSYVGHNVTEICVICISGLVITWILQEVGPEWVSTPTHHQTRLASARAIQTGEAIQAAEAAKAASQIEAI